MGVMESPCTKVCMLDASGTICVGCKRTVEEIAMWGALSDAQRARIMAELAARTLPDEGGEP